MSIRPFACERAREWVSLQLDGELSELERTLMRAHLDRCADCQAFSADLSSLTMELRTAPLELLLRPVVVPRSPRRVVVRALRVAAPMAAGVAVAFGLGLSIAGSGSNSLANVGPAFREPLVAFDQEARGLPRGTVGLDQTTPRSPRLRRLAVDV